MIVRITEVLAQSAALHKAGYYYCALTRLHGLAEASLVAIASILVPV